LTAADPNFDPAVDGTDSKGNTTKSMFPKVQDPTEGVVSRLASYLSGDSFVETN
jgi:hypothetical protein